MYLSTKGGGEPSDCGNSKGAILIVFVTVQVVVVHGGIAREMLVVAVHWLHRAQSIDN